MISVNDDDDIDDYEISMAVDKNRVSCYDNCLYTTDI